MMDFVTEIGVALPVTTVIVFLINLLFHWASAPRRVFFDQLDQLNEKDDAYRLLQKEVFDLRHQLEVKKPNLIGRIEGFIIGSTEDGRPSVIAIITITNVGTPSIAQVFSMHLKTESEELEGQLEWIPEILQLYEGDAVPDPESGAAMPRPSRIIRGSEAIYQVAMNPIPTGGKVLGYLMALFPVTSTAHFADPRSTLAVRFSDSLNSKYEIVAEDPQVGVPLSKGKVYPGEKI